MRCFSVLFRAAWWAALLLLLAGPASAQSFLESLFGGGAGASSSAGRGTPLQRYRNGGNGVRGIPLYSSQSRASRYLMSRAARGDKDDGESEHEPSGGKQYRTLCVRMCDGFYFPISFKTSRRHLHRDAKACQAGCGEEGRLYYLPSPGDDIDGMVDLTGRKYTSMENAFLYRKQLVPGCACKPAPWSAQEVARHHQYAVAARQEQERQRAEDWQDDQEQKQEHAKIASAGNEDDTEERTSSGPSNEGADDAPGGTGSPGSQKKPGDQGAKSATDAGTKDEARDHSAAAARVRTAHRGEASLSSKESVRSRRPSRPQGASRQAQRVKEGGSWFSAAQPKYTWPGDPPARYR